MLAVLRQQVLLVVVELKLLVAMSELEVAVVLVQ
jgi:hypothetical protein